MRNRLVSVMCVGLAASAGTALGQELIHVPNVQEIRLTPVNMPTLGYGSRVIVDTYDNYSNTFGGGGVYYLGNNNHIVEDISFAGSPWNNGTGRAITEVTFTIVVATGPGAGEDVILAFWDEDALTYTGTAGTGTSMLNPAMQPIVVFRFDSTGLLPGFVYAATFSPPTPIAIPDDDNGVVVQAAWVVDGFTPAVGWHDLSGGLFEPCPSGNLRGFAFSSNSLAPPGGNPATVGSTVRSYGRDMLTVTQCTHAGWFFGNTGPVPSGDNEHREIIANVPAEGGSPRQLGYVARLRGDAPPVPPPPAEDLGCLNDGTTVVNNAGGTSVKWYQFCLNAPIDDLSLKALNIDSEGSASDVAIGVFNPDGTKATIDSADDDDGSGTSAQLTFGVGRLAAVGDGRQYDGRDGQLLASGTYYLAVAPGGSTFGAGFTVNSSGTNGPFRLNLFTNVNGSALPPAVSPLTSYDFDAGFGPINPGDARQGIGEATGLRGVRWHAFTINFAAGSGTSYLDMDFFRLSTPSADGYAYLFDALGNIVAFNDDDGDELLPMFSFADPLTPPRQYGTSATVYQGQTGPLLPAGRYYLALSLYLPQDLSALPPPHRWHVRGTSGSNLIMGSDIYTGGTPVAQCDPDVNCDGSADGFDVEVMEQAVGGDMSNFCQADPDFNRDGSVDGFDIEAVESVVGGAPCP